MGPDGSGVARATAPHADGSGTFTPVFWFVSICHSAISRQVAHQTFGSARIWPISHSSAAIRPARPDQAG